jgi:hypothetical protein
MLVAVGATVGVIVGMGVSGVGVSVAVATAITVTPVAGVSAAMVTTGVLAAEDVGAAPSFDRVQAVTLKRTTNRTPIVPMPSHLRMACLLCISGNRGFSGLK